MSTILLPQCKTNLIPFPEIGDEHEPYKRKTHPFRRVNGTRLPFPDTQFDVVAMAASAGGLIALKTILSSLPQEFPAAIVIVQHLDPKHPSLMATILDRFTPLIVKQAQEGHLLKPGKVFVAPPNKHLLVNPEGTLSLSHSRMVHFVRPSADLLFESVAASFRDRAIAVILSGTGNDGIMGLKAIKAMGGKVIAQNQESSEHFGMPGAAIHSGSVDYIHSLKDISATLIDLVEGSTPP